MNAPCLFVTSRPPRAFRHRGFTLVELMVALVISLVLLAGVIQVYLSSKQSYRLQDNVARIQESGRLTTEILTRYIRLAGYRANLAQSPNQVFPSGTNQVISGTHTNGQPDTVTINFQGDGTMQDCLGNTVANLALGRNLFSVSTNGELECTSNGTTAGPLPLVGNIQDMQITYGVNNGGNVPPAASQYMTAQDVTDANAWPNVVSVRISLLVQSPEDNLVDMPQTYTFNGTSTTPSDRRLRHVFTSTIGLRNRTL
jgi:type IV pilus assembly protein PilW